MDGCESHITTANELARSLINKAKMGADSMPPLKQKLEKINEGWKRMNDTITQRLYDLESALKKCQGIEKALEDIKRWLDEKEAQLNVKDPLTITDEGLQEQLSKYTVSICFMFYPYFSTVSFAVFVSPSIIILIFTYTYSLD